MISTTKFFAAGRSLIFDTNFFNDDEPSPVISSNEELDKLLSTNTRGENAHGYVQGKEFVRMSLFDCPF